MRPGPWLRKRQNAFRVRQPVLAALAVPTADRRHRLFCQHLVAELGISGGSPLRNMRIFDSLPGDIQEQARWRRVLSDLEWDAPPLPGALPRRIAYTDITDAYEKTVSRVLPAVG